MFIVGVCILLNKLAIPILESKLKSHNLRFCPDLLNTLDSCHKTTDKSILKSLKSINPFGCCGLATERSNRTCNNFTGGKNGKFTSFWGENSFLTNIAT